MAVAAAAEHQRERVAHLDLVLHEQRALIRLQVTTACAGRIVQFLAPPFATDADAVACTQRNGGACIDDLVGQLLRPRGLAAVATVVAVQRRTIGTYPGLPPVPLALMAQRGLAATDVVDGLVHIGCGTGLQRMAAAFLAALQVRQVDALVCVRSPGEYRAAGVGAAPLLFVQAVVGWIAGSVLLPVFGKHAQAQRAGQQCATGV